VNPASRDTGETALDVAERRRKGQVVAFFHDLDDRPSTLFCDEKKRHYAPPARVIADALASPLDDDDDSLRRASSSSRVVDADGYDEEGVLSDAARLQDLSLAFEERDRIWLCLWLYTAILACVVFWIVLSVVPARDVARHVVRWAALSEGDAPVTTTKAEARTAQAAAEDSPSSSSSSRSGGEHKQHSSQEQRLLEQECREQERLIESLREERELLKTQLEEEAAAACEAQKNHEKLWHAARRSEERAKVAESRARELTAKCHDLDASSAATRATLERDLDEARRRALELERRPRNDIGLALGRLDVAQLPASTLAQVEAALPRLQLAVTREVLKREMHESAPSSNAAAADAAAAAAAGPNGECIVCLAAPRSVAFDCGHLCVCSNCAYNVDACPICREPVTERRRIFRS